MNIKLGLSTVHRVDEIDDIELAWNTRSGTKFVRTLMWRGCGHSDLQERALELRVAECVHPPYALVDGVAFVQALDEPNRLAVELLVQCVILPRGSIWSTVG